MLSLTFGLFVASLDSTAQTGNANAADWQEEVYQKVFFSMVFLSARHVEN